MSAAPASASFRRPPATSSSARTSTSTDAGVDEIFFDVAFQKDAQSRDGLLSYLERFREMTGVVAAT